MGPPSNPEFLHQVIPITHLLLRMLSRPNIASKKHGFGNTTTRSSHKPQSNHLSVLKTARRRWTSCTGPVLRISCFKRYFSRYSDIDAGAMAAAAVDEAVRNAVCTGVIFQDCGIGQFLLARPVKSKLQMGNSNLHNYWRKSRIGRICRAYFVPVSQERTR